MWMLIAGSRASIPRQLTAALLLMGLSLVVAAPACARGHDLTVARRHRHHVQHKPRRRRHHDKPRHTGTASGWVVLKGYEVSHNDQAIITQETEGSARAHYYVYGTTSALSGVINPRIGLPAGATVDASNETGAYLESATVTPPQAGHEAGVVMIVLQATTPARGLTAPATSWYLSQFDAATQHWISTKPITPPAGWDYPIVVAYTSGAADLEEGEYGTEFARLSPSGAFLGTHAAPPTTGEFPQESGVGEVTASGLALVEGGIDNGEGGECDKVWVINITTLTTQMETPGCGTWSSYSESDDVFTAQVFGINRSDGIWSTTTGQLLNSAPTSTDGEEAFVTGPRSDIVVAWDNVLNTQTTTYVLSASTGQTVYSSTSGFEAYGVADDDVWAAAYGNFLVVDGHNGKQLYGTWKVSPLDGGQGWTLCQGPPQNAGEPPQYLLRSTAPLVDSLNSAP